MSNHERKEGAGACSESTVRPWNIKLSKRLAKKDSLNGEQSAQENVFVVIPALAIEGH